MSFGKRLRKLRIEEGLTLKEIAKKFNVSETAFSNYENEYRKPNMDLISELASYFDVSVDYLLDRTEKRKVNWFDELPPELQAFVRTENIDYMKVLLNAKENKIDAETIQAIIDAIKLAKKNE